MSKSVRSRRPEGRLSPPTDDDGWSSLRAEVIALFTPGAPIDEVALFAGRQNQIEKVRDTVLSKGRHALIFGERGVGKTSLASIFHLGMSKTHMPRARKTLITEEIVKGSIESCFEDLDQTLIDSYVKAVTETRKGNIFKHVLAACALSDQDDLGRFSAASLEEPLSAIIGKPMKAPSFSFYLNELCEPTRGSILAKTGSRSHYRFRFVQPIIQPYITMKSLSSGIVSDDILTRFAIERQRSLSI